MSDSQAINSAFGYDNARANYDFASGGNVYRLNNGTNGTRNVQQVDTVANRTAQQAKADRQAAIQPAIDSYNNTKPEISNLYSTEKTRLEGNKQPLIDRYQTLLDSIKGNETTAENRQTVATNNEFAKRGLSNDSGVYQQGMADALNPITQQYTTLTKDTTSDREEGLKGINDAIGGLVPQESADLRSITQAIANLQANTGNQSVDDYLGLASQNLQNQQWERTFNEQVRQSNIAEALKKLELGSGNGGNPYQLISEGQSLINPQTGQLIYQQPKTYKETSAAVGGGW